MSERNAAIFEIKKIIVPQLREWGFRGSYPHFRRFHDDAIDLLSFQFNKWGGSFLIELSVAYPRRTEYTNCYLLGIKPFEEEIKKLNVGNTFVRFRVPNRKDEWFSYSDTDIQQVVKLAFKHLTKSMMWFDAPPIYKELNDRKAHKLRY